MYGGLQLKSSIDPSVGRFVNVLTEPPEFRRTTDNSIFGIMLFNLLLDFIHHVIEVGLLLVLFVEFFYIACSSHRYVEFIYLTVESSLWSWLADSMCHLEATASILTVILVILLAPS